MADMNPQLPGTMIVDGPQSDPWDQAFASYRQALVDLNGDGVPDSVAPINAQGRRQVQRRALAGYEPTPQQAAGLTADMPRLQQNSETLGNLGVLGASMLAPMGPVVKAVQYAPRTAGLAASLIPGFSTLNSDEADAQKAKAGPTTGPMTPQRDEQGILSAIGDNAALKSIYDQIKQAEARASASIPGVNRDSSDRIRTEAATQAAELRKQLNSELLKIQQSKMPFSDTAIGGMWPYIQAGAPIAVGLAVKGGQNLLANRGPKALENAIAQFEKSRVSGAPGDISYAAGKVGKIADDIRPAERTQDGVLPWLAQSARESGPATVAGATVGAELNLLPYQYDRRNASVGSPAYNEAQNQLTGANLMINSGVGAAIGGLGGFTASHLGHFGRKRAPMGEADNVRKYEDMGFLTKQYADETKALELQGRALNERSAVEARRIALQGIENAAPPNVMLSDLDLSTMSVLGGRSAPPRNRALPQPNNAPPTNVLAGNGGPTQVGPGAGGQLPPPNPRPQSQQTGEYRRVQPETSIAIQEGLLSGRSPQELVQQYGVSATQVNNIAKSTEQVLSAHGGDRAAALRYLNQYRALRDYLPAVAATGAAAGPIINVLAGYRGDGGY